MTLVIPQFYFPKAAKNSSKDQQFMNEAIMAFHQKEYLTEQEFQAVTEACSLPRYMNLALFRAIDMLNDQNEQVTLEQFKRTWRLLTREYSKEHDEDNINSLIYYILKKPDVDYLTPDDFLPVLEDIVLNHPALQFLENNITFQERYIETVICRIFYDAQCPTGKMAYSKFCKSDFPYILNSLTPSVDLYTIRNIFSYKQFYVLYCKLWSLDTDHDLSVTETDLCNYNMGTLTRLTVERIIEVGHIAAFADAMVITDDDAAAPSTGTETVATTTDPLASLTYFDFIWFLLSEVDKSTPMAINYWFRCLDIDDDGILSSYELSQFWQDQDIKQQFFGGSQSDGCIQFDDIMRQMNDLIQPQVPGQFALKDLKKNGFLAERFFDTFINFDRFQVHESHQEGSIREQQTYQNQQYMESGAYCYEPVMLTDDLGFPVLSNWDDYANAEYQRIILDENYANSYEEDEEEEEIDDEEYINHTAAVEVAGEDEGLVICNSSSSITASDLIQDFNSDNTLNDGESSDDSSVSSSSIYDASETPTTPGIDDTPTTDSTTVDAISSSKDCVLDLPLTKDTKINSIQFSDFE